MANGRERGPIGNFMSSKYDEISSPSDEICYRQIISIGVAELLASTIFIFVACLGCAENFIGYSLNNFEKALISGAAVMIAVNNFGHISGAHINPATSLCAFIVKEIPLILLPVYLLAQVGGSLLGFSLLVAVIPNNYTVHHKMHNETIGICVTSISDDLTIFQALGIEVILTIILIYANCSAFDHRNAKHKDALSLRLGFVVAALIAIGGHFTGASMNPIRSLGPAVWHNHWKNQWVYWVAPAIASILTSVFYRFAHRPINDSWTF